MTGSHRIFAALYDRVIERSERAGVATQRRRLIGPLTGNVIEIGAGTGRNLDHYGEVESLTLVEPDPAMRRKLARRLHDHPVRFPVEVIAATGEALPLDSGGWDAGVCTLTLCTVNDVKAVLAELQRVLRPGAPLALIEHVRAESRAAAVLQDALTPLQRLVAGGCRLNRSTLTALQGAGFDTSEMAFWTLPATIRPLHSAIVGTARAPAR